MSIKKIIMSFFCFVTGCFLSCSTVPTRETLLNDGYHNVSNYKFDPASKLDSRIQIIPDSTLKLLMEYDQKNDYQPYLPTISEMKMFTEYCKAIPPVNREIMQSSIVRIYFIKNFLGAGMADYLLSEDRRVYAILYINPQVFTTGISEWITYRENSMFIKNDNIHLNIDCGRKYTALMYLLLHETSHIVDYVQPRTPFVEPDFAAVQGLSGSMTPFVEGVWDSYDVLNKKAEITENKKLYPYGIYPASIDASEISSLYKKISLTPLMSANSARNWAEDFADMITFYHLAEQLKQPFTITISEKGAEDVVYTPMKLSQPPARLKVITGMYRSN